MKLLYCAVVILLGFVLGPSSAAAQSGTMTDGLTTLAI